MNVDQVLIAICILLGISFIVFTLYEFFVTRKLVSKWFFKGIKIIYFNEPWGDIKFQKLVEVKETTSGKFKAIDESTALFLYNQPLLSFRINSSIPLKGVIELKHGVAHISGRTPLASTLFLSIWLFGWTIGGIWATFFAKEKNNIGPLFFIGGYVVFGLMIGFSFFLEKKRLLIVLEEIKYSLNILSSSRINPQQKETIGFEFKYALIFVAVIVIIVCSSHFLLAQK